MVVAAVVVAAVVAVAVVAVAAVAVVAVAHAHDHLDRLDRPCSLQELAKHPFGPQPASALCTHTQRASLPHPQGPLLLPARCSAICLAARSAAADLSATSRSAWARSVRSSAAWRRDLPSSV